jgi:glycosyltransferase involved in cell wall biosynthesis
VSQLVLSHYPLSGNYRQRLSGRLGDGVHFAVVQEIRGGSPIDLVRALVAMRADTVTIAFEDESSRPLLPLLQVMAAVVRARRRQIADPDGNITPSNRRAALHALAWLSYESLRAGLSVARAMLATGELARAPRQRVRRTSEGPVAYLNCNLWFGVKAGGSVGHISGVVNALLETGHEVDFFTVGGRLMVNDRARIHTLRVLRMPAVPFEASFYRFDEFATAQIELELRRRPPQFIYQRMSLGNIAGVRLSRRLGVPLVIEYNGSEVWVARHWGRPLRFEKTATAAEDACLRHAHLIVTVSAALERELVARGVDPARIVTYPNCIDPSIFDPARFGTQELDRLRATVGFGATDVIATFIGTFGQWHGADILATVIRDLIESRRDELDRLRLRFLFVGDGLRLPVVRRTLALAGADRYVHFAGLVPQHEAARYLAASDILVSPHLPNADGSAFFGSPTKLFEYMAMDKAIVASDLDQLGDVLRPALVAEALPTEPPPPGAPELGVLFAPGNGEQLAAGLLFAAARADWRVVLGANARREALRKYTWRHHVAAILDRIALLEAQTELPSAESPSAAPARGTGSRSW